MQESRFIHSAIAVSSIAHPVAHPGRADGRLGIIALLKQPQDAKPLRSCHRLAWHLAASCR
jgi:hypothetical protein